MGINIGRRRTYNFHCGNYPLDRKVSDDVVTTWYPQSVVEEEYRILLKINELSGHKDGVPILLKTEPEIISLYFTYDLEEVKYSNGYQRVIDNDRTRSECLKRAKQRFEDLKTRGLLSGSNYRCPCISFSGRQAIEKALSNDTDQIVKLHDALLALLNESSLQNHVSKMILDKLDEIALDINVRSNASKIMDVINCISSLVSAFPAVNPSVRIIKNIASCLLKNAGLQ